VKRWILAIIIAATIILGAQAVRAEPQTGRMTCAEITANVQQRELVFDLYGPGWNRSAWCGHPTSPEYSLYYLNTPDNNGTGGRNISMMFRYKPETGWQSYIVGAPEATNTLKVLFAGDIVWLWKVTPGKTYWAQPAVGVVR